MFHYHVVVCDERPCRCAHEVRLGQAPDDIENLWLTEAPDPSVNSSFKLGTAAQVGVHTRSGMQTYDSSWCFQLAPHASARWHYDDADYYYFADCDRPFCAGRSTRLLRADGSVHVDARHAILEFSKPQHTVYPYTQHETPGTH